MEGSRRKVMKEGMGRDKKLGRKRMKVFRQLRKRCN